MTTKSILLAATLLIGAGCTTPAPNAARVRSGPTLVFDSTAEAGVQKRAQFLEQNGYSKDQAQQKARVEAAGKSWRVQDDNAWAREHERQARSDAREKMEKALSRLDQN